ncbi:hypothetical protein [Peribacillus loiseleuriae]
MEKMCVNMMMTTYMERMMSKMHECDEMMTSMMTMMGSMNVKG